MKPTNISVPSMRNCFSSTIFSWVFNKVRNIIQTGLFFDLAKNFVVALSTCIFALVGSMIGIISGAIKGQTTEIGLLRGIVVGAVAGAIMGIQLVDFIVNGEPFSKVAVICSLFNGEVFTEWVSTAMLKAYQWQISGMETSLVDIHDILDVNAFGGLSLEIIMQLPVNEFSGEAFPDAASCAICLQDMKDGECARSLPSCEHCFHLSCIDEWLVRQGTCPVCRQDVI